jgi:RNA polymerase sigma factor (sigma-70 family)
MRADGLKRALEHLCLADGGLTDGQLLARFIDGHDEAAFAALVRRHGPMVLGVSRRLLGNAHDAEDAFQATFLVLARKAASVVKREAVASFLYGVAYRTALRAKARAVKRRAVERQVEVMPQPEVPPAEAQDWRPLLDRELSALPEKYRAPIVLCDLEGKTRREAARQLGLVDGTLVSRLATARRMLARRLVRCGLTLSGGALAVALAEGASAAVPAALAVTTVKAAALVAAGKTAGVATPAAVLMNEVLRAMLMTKLKVYVAVGVVAVLLGAGGFAFRAAAQTRAAGESPPAEKRAEARPLTDLELLRREVDILKLQMEVMQEKMRLQEAELRALKGKGGGQGPGAVRPPAGYTPTPDREKAPEPRDGTFLPGEPGSPNRTIVGQQQEVEAGPAPTRRGSLEPGNKPELKTSGSLIRVERGAPDKPEGAGDPLADAEAALQKLRANPNDKQAADALEKAVQRVKERAKPERDSPEGF